MPSGEALDVLLKVGAFALPLLGGLIAWAISRHVKLSHLQAEHDKAVGERTELIKSLEDMRVRNLDARHELVVRNKQLSARYQEAYSKFHRLKRYALELRSQLQEMESDKDPPPELEFTSNQRTPADLEAQLAAAQQELDECRTQIDQATRTDGRIWLRTPAGSIPTFRPREQRQCTVISVLNLKGGVGKTTITANLAATMASKNSRCLLLDLDFQRSLSMLMVPSKERVVLHRAGFTVQHFLSGGEHGAKSLLERVKVLAPDLPDCAILTNSDSRSGSSGADGLEETESRLMVEWLFDRQKPDPRFFLRQALHERAVGDQYRYAFLDCPPRLTTACVNALAASDFVIIPVVPDSISLRAAENLLTSLQTLRPVVCPDLRVLAVVPNMVKIHGVGPTKAHGNALGSLRGALKERWPEPIHICESAIRYDSGFGVAAAKLDADETFELAIQDDQVASCFQKLAKELIREMHHHDSRHASAVSA